MSVLDVNRAVKRCRKDIYVREKEVRGEGKGSRTWFVPDRGDIEYIILMMMGRSRRLLSRQVEQIKYGMWTLSSYKFGNQEILVEQNEKQDLASVRFFNVGRWVQFHICRELLLQERKLVSVIEDNVAKPDSLLVISLLWYKYVLTGVEQSVGRWIRVQPSLKRLLKYRETHTTRDDLRVVQEVPML